MNGAKQTYSFCERATATSTSPWHIRRLTDAGRKLGGGADTPALCGCEVAWDLSTEVPTGSFDYVCRQCAKRFVEIQQAADAAGGK